MPGITERQLILYAMGRLEVFEYVVGLLAREARLVPTSVKDLMLDYPDFLADDEISYLQDGRLAAMNSILQTVTSAASDRRVAKGKGDRQK